MPASISDFASQVAAHVGASGAVFRTTVNGDGSLTILRSPSSTSGVWTVLYSRCVYSIPADTVTLGDGSDISTSLATPFINGLN